MTSVRRALILSLVERYLLLMLALVSNIVLARLLAPEQIGVYSVSLAVIGMAQALRDFGVGNYLIQVRELGDRQISTAFGVSLLLGLVLFAAAFAIAPWVAAYYREPRMVTTLQISSLNFLLLPFSTVSLSLLRRGMHFKRLLYVGIMASVVGAATAIGLALLSFGENSLAAGAVATNAVTGLGAWLARPERHVLRPALSDWRSVVKFGGQSSLSGMVTSISMDANDLVVGKVLGFHPVAMLSRAQGLMSLFNRDLMAAVRNVAFPAFAAAHRAGQSLEAAFARSVALVVVFAWPFYGLLSIYALEVLDLLYGPQWREAAPLVPIFCFAGVLAAVNSLTPNLLVAVGRIDLLTKLELLMQPLRLAMIAVAAVVFRTVEACAVAYMLSAALSLPVFWWFKRLCVADDAPTLLRYLLSSILVTLATIALPVLQVSWVGWSRGQPLPLWQWMSVAAIGAGCGALAVPWTAHPLASEPLYIRTIELARRAVAVWARAT